MKRDILKRCLAECIGTFALVFFGGTARLMIGDTTDPAGLLVIHIAFAATIAAMIYTLSHISAAVFNPALTLGFAASGRFPWRYLLPYWFAQCTGALLASGLDGLLLPQKAYAVHFAATLPRAGVLVAFVIEVVLTIFLMLVNMASATDKRFKRAESGVAVGLVILASGLMGNSLSGASMNPARSLGPAVFAGAEALQNVWIYWLAPCLGALIAVGLYEVIRGSSQYIRDVLDDISGEANKTDESSEGR